MDFLKDGMRRLFLPMLVKVAEDPSGFVIKKNGQNTNCAANHITGRLKMIMLKKATNRKDRSGILARMARMGKPIIPKMSGKEAPTKAILRRISKQK
jgi:transcription antitermination factor NusA-like protein